MGGTAYTQTQLEGERMFPNVGDDSETTQSGAQHDRELESSVYWTQQSARMRSGKEMSEKYAHNLLLWDRYFSNHFSHFRGALGVKSPDPLM